MEFASTIDTQSVGVMVDILANMSKSLGSTQLGPGTCERQQALWTICNYALVVINDISLSIEHEPLTPTPIGVRPDSGNSCRKLLPARNQPEVTARKIRVSWRVQRYDKTHKDSYRTPKPFEDTIAVIRSLHTMLLSLSSISSFSKYFAATVFVLIQNVRGISLSM